MDVEIRGGGQFRAAARALRAAENRKELTKELRKGILDAVPALKDAVRESAPEYMPDRYAGELVPTLRMTTSTATGGDQVTVRISTAATGRGGHPRQVDQMEAGTLRHPVFGRTRRLRRHAVHRRTSKNNPWVVQKVRSGFVTGPMTQATPEVRREIEAAVDRLLDKIARG